MNANKLADALRRMLIWDGGSLELDGAALREYRADIAFARKALAEHEARAQAAHPSPEHQQLFDTLGAKDQEDAARIIAEHHARELAQPVGVPDGWVMVPKRDITSAMMSAGLEWWHNCPVDNDDRAATVACIFAAMRDVAPQPPSSIAGLRESGLVRTSGDVDEGVSVPASGAQKEASVVVDVGLDSAEHDLKTTVFARPHGAESTPTVLVHKVMEPEPDYEPRAAETVARWLYRCGYRAAAATIRSTFPPAPQPPAQPESEPQNCNEADGCPTELAVLKRFWREHQAAQPVGDLRVEVQSVAVSDTPDAHQVWLRRGVQQFPVGDYRDTREEAEWYAGQLRTALQPVGVPDVFDFAAHLQRQRGWSGATFGPGARVQGVVDHIRKELREIEANPGDLEEWIDVAILALDGAWRSGAQPADIVAALVAKQTKNERRKWPDWRTADPNKAIEHDRSKDAAPQPSADAEDGRTVEDDVRDFGEGFEVDGRYVHPSRVTVYINTSEGIFGRTVTQDAARAAEGDGNG